MELGQSTVQEAGWCLEGALEGEAGEPMSLF